MIKILTIIFSINLLFAQNKDRQLLPQSFIAAGEIVTTEAIRKSGYNNSKKLGILYENQNAKLNALFANKATQVEIEAAKIELYLTYRKIQGNILSGLRTFTLKVAGATILYLDTGYRIYQLVMTEDDPGFIALIP